jgi:hypothetical protein
MHRGGVNNILIGKYEGKLPLGAWKQDDDIKINI